MKGETTIPERGLPYWTLSVMTTTKSDGIEGSVSEPRGKKTVPRYQASASDTAAVHQNNDHHIAIREGGHGRAHVLHAATATKSRLQPLTPTQSNPSSVLFHRQRTPFVHEDAVSTLTSPHTSTRISLQLMTQAQT